MFLCYIYIALHSTKGIKALYTLLSLYHVSFKTICHNVFFELMLNPDVRTYPKLQHFLFSYTEA